MSKLLVRKKGEKPVKISEEKPIRKKEEKIVKSNEERLVRFRILSHKGDKIHIKLPKPFVKLMIKNNTIDFFNNTGDIVDSQKLLSLLIDAMEYDLVGEVAHLERSNGDIVRVIID